MGAHHLTRPDNEGLRYGKSVRRPERSTMGPEPPWRVEEIPPEGRDAALVPIRASFTGIYRWHAKRTLREISRVRGIRSATGDLIAISMIELLVPEVGYVYYVAVMPELRRHGLGRALLEDALTLFRGTGAEVVYAAVEEDNRASLALFQGGGFRAVERRELSYREGGLGAWGLRSRMRLVGGEILLGLRLRPHPAGGGSGPPSVLRTA